MPKQPRQPKQSRQPRRNLAQSNTYRFFVPPDVINGRTVHLTDDDLVRQIGNVLRAQPGEEVLLLDNSGWQYVVTLDAVERNVVSGTVTRKELAPGEPRTKVTLYVALMRPERFEWALQKGTELGVSAFVPVVCERSTIADANDLSDRKLERWERIIREAAEQACRGKLPRLAPALFFPVACEQAARRGTTYLLWEGDGAVPLRTALRQTTSSDANTGSPFSVAVFSGPEGGFAPGELNTARDYDIAPVTLGPRILRAETAPLVAATCILFDMGDLDSPA